MYKKACKVVFFSNLNLLLFCRSSCRRRRRCLSSLMCRDRDNWCEKRADRTRPVRLACFLAWLVQAKLIFITGKKNCTIQVPPPNQRRTVELKTLSTKLKCQFATSDTRGELGRVNFRKDFWDWYAFRVQLPSLFWSGYLYSILHGFALPARISFSKRYEKRNRSQFTSGLWAPGLPSFLYFVFPV